MNEESVTENKNLYDKINLIENEVAEIKNERQALTNLRQKVHWAADA